MNIQEKVTVHMYDFDDIQRGNYPGRESASRIEVEGLVRRMKNGKAAGRARSMER